MTNDSVAVSIAAWRKNIPPPQPKQYNQFFQITQATPGTPTIFALVAWNWERGRYEMRPVTFVDKSTYNHVDLELGERSWYGLRHTLRNLGIKHLLSVRCKTKPQKPKPSNLPAVIKVVQLG